MSIVNTIKTALQENERIVLIGESKRGRHRINEDDSVIHGSNFHSPFCWEVEYKEVDGSKYHETWKGKHTVRNASYFLAPMEGISEVDAWNDFKDSIKFPGIDPTYLDDKRGCVDITQFNFERELGYETESGTKVRTFTDDKLKEEGFGERTYTFEKHLTFLEEVHLYVYPTVEQGLGWVADPMNAMTTTNFLKK